MVKSNNSIATGLAADHYCVVTDSVNMCSDTSYVAISEPSAISASIITQDATNPTTANGTATANISGGTACFTSDTIVPGTHASNFNSATLTRGIFFQAPSDFNISHVKASDGNTQVHTGQSIEIVDFGTTPPPTYPTTGGTHIPFSAINTSDLGWLATGGVVSGNLHGIIGAYHNATTLHNSYGASGQ